MKIVKMLMSWNCTAGELCGDMNYTLDDNVANDLIDDGRAEFIGNFEAPIIEAPAAEVPEASADKRSTRKKSS
jgi:hypothetical protein